MYDPRYRVLGGVTLEIVDVTLDSGSGRVCHSGVCRHVTPGEWSGRWDHPEDCGYVTLISGSVRGVTLETVCVTPSTGSGGWVDPGDCGCVTQEQGLGGGHPGNCRRLNLGTGL